MAITHIKQRLEPIAHDDVLLALLTRELPEGASQTWPEGSPVSFSSGLLVEFVAPTTALLAGYALDAGHNTTGRTATIVLARAPIEIEVNFLGAAAADNVLAAADMGGKFDLLKSTTLIKAANPGWYLSDATADPSHRITQFAPAKLVNQVETVSAAGDTNARVRCAPIDTKTHWNAT